MNKKIDSIFKVIVYSHKYLSKRRSHYPEFLMDTDNVVYFKRLGEVERYIKKEAKRYEKINARIGMKDDQVMGLYAYVVIEIPLAMEVNIDLLDQYLSLRIYLPDGSLWGENTYSNFTPHHWDVDSAAFWGIKKVFLGRRPEEIKFKPGDIVEVIGCPGNVYWDNDRVTLAIVVGTPENVEQAAKRKEEFLAAHKGYDVTEVDLAYEFNAFDDRYEVIPYGCDFIDHSPTICVMNPTKPISSRRRKALLDLYEKYKNNELTD